MSSKQLFHIFGLFFFVVVVIISEGMINPIPVVNAILAGRSQYFLRMVSCLLNNISGLLGKWKCRDKPNQFDSMSLFIKLCW